jgi:hypothetical protein
MFLDPLPDGRLDRVVGHHHCMGQRQVGHGGGGALLHPPLYRLPLVRVPTCTEATHRGQLPQSCPRRDGTSRRI